MRPRFRNALLNLSLLLGSLVLTIAVLEIGLRLTGIEHGRVVPPPLYQRSANQDISYELKPNMKEYAFRSVIETSSLGFRSPEIDGDKPTLAVLGDSITFGYGVKAEESIPGRLGTLLPAWNVVNAGVPGYNLLQETETYKDKLAKYNPKALVLVFYWNDLHDMVPAELSNDGNLYPRGTEPPASGCSPATDGLLGLVPGKCWLDTHSAIYRVLKKIASARTEKSNQHQQEADFRKDPFAEAIPDADVEHYARQLDTFVPSLSPALPRLFVIWPERPLHLTLRPKLRAIAEARGFQVLDLYDVFGNAPETLSWDTVHPSAKTDAQAAEVIKAALEHWNMTARTGTGAVTPSARP